MLKTFDGMKIALIISPAYEYLTATLIEGLILDGHTVFCSENSNYGTHLADEEFCLKAETADVVVMCSGIKVRYELANKIKNPRKVYVDGSDSQLLRMPKGFDFLLIFKRELNRMDASASNQRIFPLPFAAERRYFHPNNVNKDILISFLATMDTNPLRYSIHKRLSNLKSLSVVSGSTQERAYSPGTPKSLPTETPNYRAILHRSLISVNVPGAGWDCARYWEILSSGAMLFTFEPDILIPNGFTDGLDCVTFSSLDEFEDKLNFYTTNLDKVNEIAKRGYDRLLSFHTTKSRASYFMAIVQEHLETAIVS